MNNKILVIFYCILFIFTIIPTVVAIKNGTLTILAPVDILNLNTRNNTQSNNLEVSDLMALQSTEIYKLYENQTELVYNLSGTSDLSNISLKYGKYMVLQHYDNETFLEDFEIKEGEISTIQPKHKVYPPVHQWIAKQAFYIWPNDVNHELYILGFIQDYNGQLDPDGYNSDEGILIGSGEEDTHSGQAPLCPPNGEPYCWHFWEADEPQNGVYNDGVLTYDSSYTRALILYNNAISYYQSGDKDRAYYWLGRLAHLITDASVPAHSHLDIHVEVLGGLTGGDDEFEDFMAEYNSWGDGKDNYQHFTGSSYVGQQYKYENINLPSGVKTNPPNLFKLFWYTTQKTQYYASDDKDGNSCYYKEDNSGCYTFSPSLWYNEGVVIISNKGDVEDWLGNGNIANLKKISEANIPHAMKSVAGLYRLFWAETHNLQPCVSGVCCNNLLGLTKENGQQPTGYLDEYICGSNKIYWRNYYCNGISANYQYFDTLQSDCNNNCKYCDNDEIGISSCRNRPLGYNYDATQRCSGNSNTYTYGLLGEFLARGYCDGSGNDKFTYTSSVYNVGCDPDDDNDGILDINDNCPTQFGPWYNNGCPDITLPIISFINPTELPEAKLNKNSLLVSVNAYDWGLNNVTIKLYSLLGMVNSSTSVPPPFFANLSSFVNFTFLTDGIYYFNATATDLANNKRFTETRNVTIDTIKPRVNIIQPLNRSYNYNMSALNYTFFDANLAKCWYSLNKGVTNLSVICGQNITGLTSNYGSNTWTVWTNDSAGNENRSSVTFTIDTVKPIITINSPLNNTYSTSTIRFNATINEVSNVDVIWYNIQNNSRHFNNTKNVSFDLNNFTEGNRIVYINAVDSAGNSQNSYISFVINIPVCIDNDNDGYNGYDSYECPNGNDCNDNNFNINPNKNELCNNLDDNCNNQTDEVFNLGNSCTVGIGACQRIGQLICNGQGNATICNIQPGNVTQEVCNILDDDCDGSTDEELGTTQCGLGICQHTVDNCTNGQQQTCNPYQGTQTESCDSLDNNCDGSTDEEGAIGSVRYYSDLDGDGYGLIEDSKLLCNANRPYTSINTGDCDDENSSINPNANEIIYDGKDNDCNPLTWDDDLDGDGYKNATDCNDNNNLINPGVEEICNNSIDDNCDSLYTAPYCFVSDIISPQPKVYGKKNVNFDVVLNENVVKMEYADNSDRYITMCKNCIVYNKTKSFKEGHNNLTLKLTRNDGSVMYVQTEFVVDSSNPKIKKILPKTKTCTNGTFEVQYDESNLRKTTLYYGNDVKSEVNCVPNRKGECLFNVNLSKYENKWINYTFELNDTIHTHGSKNYNVSVDTIKPIVTLKSPQNDNIYGKYVLFDISANEEVSCEYLDNRIARKKLFSDKMNYADDKLFANGNHNVIVECTDNCGNSVKKILSFTVDY